MFLIFAKKRVQLPAFSLLLVMLAGLCVSGCGRDDGGRKPRLKDDRLPLEKKDPAVKDKPDAPNIPEDVTDEPAPGPAMNVLLVIADDLGVDALSLYPYTEDPALTPHLSALAEQGVVFDNAWATPMCTTTRATLLTGMHGVKSGVTYVPAPLPEGTETLQAMLSGHPDTDQVVSAVFGKWHVGGANPPPDHPELFGVPHYAGNLSGNLDSYVDWPLTVNGETTQVTTYHTTEITQQAIDWIDAQTTAWFAWVAYSAPHSPFHLPPAELHTRELSGTAQDIEDNPRPYFLAAIEAIDTEVGRLLAALPEETRENTLVIFIGDNGSPRSVIDREVFPVSHGKKTLYEGGIRVPLVISGAAIPAGNRRSEALVNSVDLFPTIGEFLGVRGLRVYEDGYSVLDHLIKQEDPLRIRNYTEFESDQLSGWTVRDERYKLIRFMDGSEALYDLSVDLREENNLIDDPDLSQTVRLLRQHGRYIRESAVEETDITGQQFSNTSPLCADYVGRYRATARDVGLDAEFSAESRIEIEDGKCRFYSNSIPNHDFNDGSRSFANQVAEVGEIFYLPQSPAFAESTAALSLNYDNAIMLNGVKVDVLSAGCYGIDNGRTGCNWDSQPWRYDPMHEANGFSVDSYHAHAQPDGAYHYHGPVNVLDSGSATVVSGVIGFAADGFPIFGAFFDDGNAIRAAVSSYRLKSGSRPDGENEPGGTYDGQFIDDYEYVDGLGDLDECNGMTVDGQYGYYLTEDYPYVVGCFKGTPDPSFQKGR